MAYLSFPVLAPVVYQVCWIWRICQCPECLHPAQERGHTLLKIIDTSIKLIIISQQNIVLFRSHVLDYIQFIKFILLVNVQCPPRLSFKFCFIWPEFHLTWPFYWESSILDLQPTRYTTLYEDKTRTCFYFYPEQYIEAAGGKSTDIKVETSHKYPHLHLEEILLEQEAQ